MIGISAIALTTMIFAATAALVSVAVWRVKTGRAYIPKTESIGLGKSLLITAFLLIFVAIGIATMARGIDTGVLPVPRGRGIEREHTMAFWFAFSVYFSVTLIMAMCSVSPHLLRWARTLPR